MTLRETVDYYSDLLLLQYRSKPRARANIAIYVKQVLADMLAASLLTCFDVPVAIGPQLDILGKYVGVPRNIGEPIDRPYFSFSESTGLIRPNGFNDSTNPAVNAQAIFYQTLFLGSENTALTDAAYKLILQLKIILNSNDGTLASIQAYLHEFLPGLVELVDNKDMTLTYILSGKSPVSTNVLKGYLPKPMGVGINFVALSGTVPSTTTKTKIGLGLQTCVSDPITVVPVNGIGPFNYSWEFLSGDTNITADLDPTNPTTHFRAQANIPPDLTRIAVFRCAITDSLGIVGVTNDITVTLIFMGPP